MFDDTMKLLSRADKDKLILALNTNASCIIRVDDKFVGVHTTAPSGYETEEIKGNWICGSKVQNK